MQQNQQFKNFDEETMIESHTGLTGKKELKFIRLDGEESYHVKVVNGNDVIHKIYKRLQNATKKYESIEMV